MLLLMGANCFVSQLTNLWLQFEEYVEYSFISENELYFNGKINFYCTRGFCYIILRILLLFALEQILAIMTISQL